MSVREPITREQVITLITRYRPHLPHAPAEATVAAWLTSLQSCTFGECEAAMLALGPSAARAATPSEIVGRVEAARDRAHTGQAVTRRTRRGAERAGFAQAGAVGIRQVYAVMGWEFHPARGVHCPFCDAEPDVACSPLTRARDGRRERRDPRTQMHTSRLDAANNLKSAGARL